MFSLLPEVLRLLTSPLKVIYVVIKVRFQHPNVCFPILLPAGAMRITFDSKIGIDGNTLLTRNTALRNGGENGCPSRIA